MTKEEKSSPRSKAGGVAINEIQKAIRLFRLHPPEHAGCQKAVDEALEMTTKAVERYGPIEVEITRDGLMVDESPVVRTGDDKSDLAILLFPSGIRSLHIGVSVTRAEIADFARIVAARDAHLAGDAAEHDVATELWQSELKAIEYRLHDPLSPTTIGGRLDPALVPVARRIQDLASAIGGGTAQGETEVQAFLAEADRRSATSRPGGEAGRVATQAERAAEYLASPAGTGRRALATELESVPRAALLDRAADVVVWAAQQAADAPAPEDSGAFLGTVALAALLTGDLERATTFLERASAADKGSGAIASVAAARLGTEAGLAALASALEKRAAGLPPDAIQARGQAILRHLGAPAVAAAVKVQGTLTNDAVRAAFRAFIVSKAGEAPEPIVALTLHADRKVVEDALAILSTGGPHGPAWKHVEAIARSGENKVRTQIAADLVERLSGEKDRKDAVRVIAHDADKAKRLQTAGQLTSAGAGAAKSFDELAAYVLEDRFAGRDEDEVDAVLSALTAIGKLRAVRVLTTLVEKKPPLLFRRNEVKRVGQIAQKKLEQLKGRGGA